MKNVFDEWQEPEIEVDVEADVPDEVIYANCKIRSIAIREDRQIDELRASGLSHTADLLERLQKKERAEDE